MGRWLTIAAAAALLLARGALGAPPPTPPCPGARFVTDVALVPDGRTADAIVLDDAGQLSVENACAPSAATLRKLRGQVRVRLTAKLVACAMQRYGMLLADGGNVALTAASDRFATHTWAEVGIDSHSLTAIQVSDMAVVDLGPTIPLTYDCVRTP